MLVDEDAKKAEKRARSEAQRVESMRLKGELDQKRSELVSGALKETAGPKKIVFADSDDEESVEEIAKPSTANEEVPPPKKKLFADSSDDEDDEKEEKLLIDNRHKGKKGMDLMKMESRFNNDARFKMDDKFASSDSESEEEEEDTELTEEKKKQRALLSKILGKEVKLPSKHKDKGPQIPTRPFTRFDPDNEEHVEWMKKYGTATKGPEKEPVQQSEKRNKWDSKAEEDAAQALPERHVGGTFFELDNTFADELKAKLAAAESANAAAVVKKDEESGGFSFLKMMGRDEPKPAAPLISKYVEEDIVRPSKKTRRMLGQRVSDDEDDAEEDYNKNAESNDSHEPAKAIAQPTLLGTVCETFFVTGEEPHIQQVVASFQGNKRNMATMVSKWRRLSEIISKKFRCDKRTALKKVRNEQDKKNWINLKTREARKRPNGKTSAGVGAVSPGKRVKLTTV